MKKVQAVLGTLFMLTILTPAFTDGFRVRSVQTAVIDYRNPETQTIELGYNDAIGIRFPASPLFVRGFEIEIKIPQEILSYRNSMAWGLYSQVLPLPETGIIDYQAEQIQLQPLPSRLSFVLQVPTVKKHGLKTGPYATVLNYIHDPLKGALLFRLLPVMKGLPENIDKMIFPVRIKPILADEGGLSLSIIAPPLGAGGEKNQLTVRIDENLITNPSELIVLSPGQHHLSIVADEYRNEVRVFTVESARITALEVTLKDTIPRLYLTAPENAVVFIDGVKVENSREPMKMESGEHILLFRIGDYEISKTLTMEKGKDYTVSMLIDIAISETP